jgi:hypothetical protein
MPYTVVEYDAADPVDFASLLTSPDGDGRFR